MSDPITLAEAQTKLTEALAAESAVLQGAQAYSIGGRSLTRADLSTIRESIRFWRGEVARLQAIASGATNGGVMTAAWR